MAQEQLSLPTDDVVIRVGLDGQVVFSFKNKAWAEKFLTDYVKPTSFGHNIKPRMEDAQRWDVRVPAEYYDNNIRGRTFILEEEIKKPDIFADAFSAFGSMITGQPQTTKQKNQGFTCPKLTSVQLKTRRDNSIKILDAVCNLFLQQKLNIIRQQDNLEFMSIFHKDDKGNYLKNPEYLLFVLQNHYMPSNKGRKYTAMIDLLLRNKYNLTTKSEFEAYGLVNYQFKELLSPNFSITKKYEIVENIDAEIEKVMKFTLDDLVKFSKPASTAPTTTTTTTTTATTTTTSTANVNNQSVKNIAQHIVDLLQGQLFDVTALDTVVKFTAIDNVGKNTNPQIYLTTLSDELKKVNLPIYNDASKNLAMLVFLLLTELDVNADYSHAKMNVYDLAGMLTTIREFKVLQDRVKDGTIKIDTSSSAGKYFEKLAGKVIVNAPMFQSAQSATGATPPPPPPVPTFEKTKGDIENENIAKEINISSGIFKGFEKIVDKSSKTQWAGENGLRAQIVKLFKDKENINEKNFKAELGKILTSDNVKFKQDGESVDAFARLERNLNLAYQNRNVERKNLSNPNAVNRENLVDELKKGQANGFGLRPIPTKTTDNTSTLDNTGVKLRSVGSEKNDADSLQTKNDANDANEKQLTFKEKMALAEATSKKNFGTPTKDSSKASSTKVTGALSTPRKISPPPSDLPPPVVNSTVINPPAPTDLPPSPARPKFEESSINQALIDTCNKLESACAALRWFQYACPNNESTSEFKLLPFVDENLLSRARNKVNLVFDHYKVKEQMTYENNGAVASRCEKILSEEKYEQTSQGAHKFVDDVLGDILKNINALPKNSSTDVEFIEELNSAIQGMQNTVAGNRPANQSNATNRFNKWNTAPSVSVVNLPDSTKNNDNIGPRQ